MKTQQEKLEKEGQSLSTSTYFVKQLVPNACGTIAVVHAIANNMSRIQLDSTFSRLRALTFPEEKALFKFITSTQDKSPLERGELLGYDEGIAKAHEDSSKKGQTVRQLPSFYKF